MADKEERIIIIKVEPECIYREIHETTAGGFTTIDLMCTKKKHALCDKKMFSECKHKKLSGISSAEAIERMAKAICKQTNYQCSVCQFENNKEKCEEWIVFQYKTQAEAALNALLEGK